MLTFYETIIISNGVKEAFKRVVESSSPPLFLAASIESILINPFYKYDDVLKSHPTSLYEREEMNHPPL
jgi:hypothetical protein